MKPDTTNPDLYKRTFRFSQWTKFVTVLEEHRLFARMAEFNQWSRAKHEQVSRDYLAQALATQRIYHAMINQALATYGDHGQLISGVIRDHFPEATKDALRIHAHWMNEFNDKSIAHWRAAWKTMVTWRRLRDEMTNAKVV